jgi:GT2 family glycosyltransferase
MKYHFLHVNYNNSLLTINCIESILLAVSNLDQKDVEYEIVIVDNNSSVSEKNILTNYMEGNGYKYHDHIKIVYVETNLGYFRALNVALKLSVRKSNDFVIIGNNDLKFKENFLITLHNKIIQNDVFVLAPNIITLDGIHQNPHVVNRISLLRKIIYNIYFTNYYIALTIFKLTAILKIRKSEQDKLDFEKEQNIYMGFGACYILTPAFFEKYRILDDSVFLMGEEALLAHQVRIANGKTLYCPDLVVFHEDHSTFKKIPLKDIYNITRQSFQIYKKYL